MIAALDRRTVAVLAAMSVGLFAAELAETVFATTLPTVVSDLGALPQVPWVSTAYLVCSVVAMSLSGKLSDLVGRRLVFSTGVGVFLVGSLLGAVAASMPMLLLARAIQGLGGGGLLVVLHSVVADRVPVRERAGVMSALGAVFALAAVAGPPLGGLLADGIGWRWAFWLNLPLGLLALAAVALLLPRDEVRERSARIDLRIDLLGAAALTLVVTGLVALAGLATSAPRPLLLLIAGGALLALAGFGWVEGRAAEPLVPVRLFGHRTFGVAVLAGAAVGLATFGVVAYLPIHLQLVTGATATMAGLLLLAMVAGLASATVIAAQVVRRTGRFRGAVTAGGGLAATGLVALAYVGPNTSPSYVVAALFLLGAGIGGTWEIVVVIAQSTVPAAEVGAATATNAVTREVGVCVGTAVVGGWIAARLGPFLADGTGAGALASVGGLPTAERVALAEAYAGRVAPMFWLLAAVALVATLTFRLLPSALADDAAAKRADRVPQPALSGDQHGQ